MATEMFVSSFHVIAVVGPANQHPENTTKEKGPYTFARLVNFSNKCVGHV